MSNRSRKQRLSDYVSDIQSTLEKGSSWVSVHPAQHGLVGNSLTIVELQVLIPEIEIRHGAFGYLEFARG